MTEVEFAVLVAVAVIAAVLKSITGMGFPLILIPALALVIDIADAVVIVAPANLYLNGSLVWRARGERAEAPALPSFLIGGIAGATVGSLLLSVLPENVLRWVLVAVIALFLVNRVRAPAFAVPARLVGPLSPIVGTVAGVFQGAAGISGPIVSPWFLSLRLARDTYVFCIASAFAVSGTAQMVGLAAQGLYRRDLLAASALLIVLVVVVMPIGVRIRALLPVAAFEWTVVGLLTLSGVALAARSL